MSSRWIDSALRTLGLTPSRLALAIAALLFVLGAMAFPRSGRANSPAVGADQIVAVSSGSGPQIEMLQPNGRSRVVYRGLKAEDAFIDGLSFSPGGTELAFTESGGNPNRALMVLNLSSKRAVQVPTAHLTANSPSFLRDGRIVFSGGREGADRQGGT